jgi:GNAT superfamily N-acetyltransferase
MNSLYQRYIKECWNREYIEWPFGFIAYEINQEHLNLHICDVYILEEFRGKNNYAVMLKEVEKRARDLGLKYLTGNISRRLPNMEQSVMAQLKNGGKFVHTDGCKVTMAKEL